MVSLNKNKNIRPKNCETNVRGGNNVNFYKKLYHFFNENIISNYFLKKLNKSWFVNFSVTLIFER